MCRILFSLLNPKCSTADAQRYGIQTHDLHVTSTMLWSYTLCLFLNKTDDKQKWDAAEVNNTKSQLE